VQRNQSLRLKNHREQMLLAKARGELVEKRLVELQAAFLLAAMHRQAMALPQTYCDRLAAVSAPLEIKAILDEAMRGLLTEMQELPHRIDATAWEKFLAEQETAGGGAPSESEEKPAKAKTPRRRHDSRK
jgi:hypothetical protein